jgi:hypothetical protein
VHSIHRTKADDLSCIEKNDNPTVRLAKHNAELGSLT